LAGETGGVLLTVKGEVKNRLELKLADLQSMPRVEARVRDGDGTAVTFEGVSLWDILQKAQFLDAGTHKKLVNTCVIVKAKDGYKVVYSLAEIAPTMTDRKVFLADRCNGKALAEAQGPLKVIAPDEKMRARWVRQVTALEVVSFIEDKSK
jgi:DMSO/TMAO reductase YedYZ molybdopterin-dependent catalytic subunit